MILLIVVYKITVVHDDLRWCMPDLGFGFVPEEFSACCRPLATGELEVTLIKCELSPYLRFHPN
jgi:hypothetical protein